MSDCSHIKEIICRNSETFHILLMLWCLRISPSHLLQKLLQSSPSYLVYETVIKVTFSSIRHYAAPVCHNVWKARLKKKTQKYCLLTGVKLCVCFWELDYTYRMTQYVLSVQRLMSVNLRLYSWFGWWLWQLKKKKNTAWCWKEHYKFRVYLLTTFQQHVMQSKLLKEPFVFHKEYTNIGLMLFHRQ